MEFRAREREQRILKSSTDDQNRQTLYFARFFADCSVREATASPAGGHKIDVSFATFVRLLATWIAYGMPRVHKYMFGFLSNFQRTNM